MYRPTIDYSRSTLKRICNLRGWRARSQFLSIIPIQGWPGLFADFGAGWKPGISENARNRTKSRVIRKPKPLNQKEHQERAQRGIGLAENTFLGGPSTPPQPRSASSGSLGVGRDDEVEGTFPWHKRPGLSPGEDAASVERVDYLDIACLKVKVLHHRQCCNDFSIFITFKIDSIL